MVCYVYFRFQESLVQIKEGYKVKNVQYAELHYLRKILCY